MIVTTLYSSTWATSPRRLCPQRRPSSSTVSARIAVTAGSGTHLEQGPLLAVEDLEREPTRLGEDPRPYLA